MKLYIVVDWLNFTADRPMDVRPKDVMYPTGGKLEEAKALHGYTKAYTNELGVRAMWHDTRVDMGIHIQYSGGTLNRYLDSGITAQEIARHHAQQGHRCARIDVAIDCVDSDINIEALYELVRSGKYTLPYQRKAALLTSSDGVTMYIGSRTSEVFVRIYDKGAEQKTDDNWKRVELELKGSRAMFFVNILVQEGPQQLGDTARQVLTAVANFDDQTWRAIVGNEPLRVGKAKVEQADTKTWLITQVAPAMGRYIARSGDHALVEQFWAVVAAFSGKALDDTGASESS